jgi:hydroxymethylpyrimidine pyrophosphatase-like HAD family hydrolase
MGCKLFVSDIDGTLLDRYKRVHPSDIDAIRELHENGVSFCLASGRMYEEIKSVMDGMGVPYYAVCQNGASVYDRQGLLLASHTFEAVLALSIIRFLEGTGLVTVVCAADGNYVAVKDRLAEVVGERFLSELMEDCELPIKVKNG